MRRSRRAGALTGFLTLGFVFCGLTFAWLAAYSFAVASARRWLELPLIRRSIDGVAGFVLIGFGIRLALSHD